jgi:antagonist of KipI
VTVFQVELPGLFTTIQDRGRNGHYASGVPAGGAMDRFALSAANLLVGNPTGAPALECTLTGPTLVALRSCVIAVTGADLGPRVNERPVDLWRSVFMAPGDRLSFAGRRWGARCYVAVAGGIAGDRWLGSASTYVLVERGGIHGRPLKAGDELRLDGEPPHPAVAGRFLPPADRPEYTAEPVLDVVIGPHAGKLKGKGRRTLFEARWQVSNEADRMGYRMEGPELTISVPELISFGLAHGCIQVPPSGQPIVLLADHQTAGGYPVVGAVTRACLPLISQLLPGDHARFREVPLADAHAAWAEQQEALRRLGA